MNATVTAVAAQFVNETVSSPTAATSTVGWYVVCIVGISLVLFTLLVCGLPVLGFVGYGIVPLSYAAMWMASLGSVAAGSLFALLQSIAMGGVPLLIVLLCIVAVVTLAVGAFHAVEWLVHMWESGAVHVPTGLVDAWDSATAWVLHLWHSGDGMLGWWNDAVAWVQHLWDSIPVYLK